MCVNVSTYFPGSKPLCLPYGFNLGHLSKDHLLYPTWAYMSWLIWDCTWVGPDGYQMGNHVGWNWVITCGISWAGHHWLHIGETLATACKHWLSWPYGEKLGHCKWAFKGLDQIGTIWKNARPLHCTCTGLRFWVPRETDQCSVWMMWASPCVDGVKVVEIYFHFVTI